MWLMVSGSSSQIGHKGSVVMYLLNRFSFVGKILLHSFHKKKLDYSTPPYTPYIFLCMLVGAAALIHDKSCFGEVICTPNCMVTIWRTSPCNLVLLSAWADDHATDFLCLLLVEYFTYVSYLFSTNLYPCPGFHTS